VTTPGKDADDILMHVLRGMCANLREPPITDEAVFTWSTADALLGEIADARSRRRINDCWSQGALGNGRPFSGDDAMRLHDDCDLLEFSDANRAAA
jgi:hypothetical protein